MILLEALKDGLILSILMSGMIMLIEFVNPRYELQNYPQGIKNIVKPKTEQEKFNFKSLALPMMLVVLVYYIGTLLKRFSGVDVSYMEVFLHSLIMMVTWNVFDLVVVDWLVFCTITPKFMIIPGTEGNSSYKDYKFHINESLGKGMIVGIGIASVVATIAYILL